MLAQVVGRNGYSHGRAQCSHCSHALLCGSPSRWQAFIYRYICSYLALLCVEAVEHAQAQVIGRVADRLELLLLRQVVGQRERRPDLLRGLALAPQHSAGCTAYSTSERASGGFG